MTKTHAEFLEELKDFLLNEKYDFTETKNSPAISYICDTAINKIEQFQAEQKQQQLSEDYISEERDKWV